MTARRGYFGIGIYHTKNVLNVGCLWRSAYLFGASYIFTIGHRYHRQPSDTVKAWKHIPLFAYADFEQFQAAIPHECRLVGIELIDEARPLSEYTHPERAVYLLGAEDSGLPSEVVDRCHDLIVLPGDRSMNVAVAGSIVMYDRGVKAVEG